MTAHEIHSLSGAYAVDALDDLERARFEQHLSVCADCQVEVASLRESAAHLGELDQTPPPSALRDRVLSEIKSVRPLPPQVPTDEELLQDDLGARRSASAPRHPRQLVVRRLGVAAAVLAMVGVGSVVTVEQLRDDQSHTQVLSASDRVLRAADARSVHVDLPGDASARVVVSDSVRKALLITHGMQDAPAGKVYELWLQNRAGTMVPAGLMERGGDQEFLLTGDASAAQAAGITVEPAGGSAQPTSAPLALFDFAKAT